MVSSVPGILVVVSGPSGVGKGTICRRLLELDEDTRVSVSATTRSPRRGEKDGVHYHFISREDFLRRLEQGDFLEWAQVYGNYYGTLNSEVDRLLAAGKNVLLEIDTQGAKQIRERRPCLSVFIMPPSQEELLRRLRGRGSESRETLNLRTSRAEAEMAESQQYDQVIINDKIETAAWELLRLIRERRNQAEK